MLRPTLLAILALVLALGALPAVEGATPRSGITHADIDGVYNAGTFGNEAYERAWGTVYGVVAPDEPIAGLAALPKDAAGMVEYSAHYELIGPATPTAADDTLLVEAESRGSPLLLSNLEDFVATGRPGVADYPDKLGNAFLFSHHIAYARVQWQTGIAAGVPAGAQGIGEVIVRDFGRWLSVNYRTRLLGGISQAGWFVETFVAEGFNQNPVDGKPVYNGAFAVDGTGNWLALNQLAQANHTPEQPYVDPVDPKPIAAEALLHRPASDPFFVDVANYTDFYRVHASLSDTTALPANMRRYDWPSPHAPATAAAAFDQLHCNGGTPVQLNPIGYAPYLRAVVLELAKRVGSHAVARAPALPPSTVFELGPAPSDTSGFNPLPGVTLRVPLVDDDAQPKGGVRFPEVDNPIGKPFPVALPPVVTTSIDVLCGNRGEWQPFSAAELARRYQSQDAYVQRYAASLDGLISAGYVLPEDRAGMLRRAAALYANPGGY